MNWFSSLLNWFRPAPCMITQIINERENRLNALTVTRKTTISDIIQMTAFEDEFGSILEKGVSPRGKR